MFIRVMDTGVGTMCTDNNKQNKVDLRYEGVDLGLYGTKVAVRKSDYLLWLPPGGDGYVPFEQRDWKKIQSREIKL